MLRKFKLGQRVRFSPTKSGLPPPNTTYHVVRLLPSEGSDQLYRVKCEEEAFDRVAKEYELS